MARPVIGITTYVVPAAWGHWQLEAALIPYDYVRAVERAGGRAFLIPPDGEEVEETLSRLDGLVFSGGEDIGQHSERDRGEFALLQAALERDLPVLAICRGVEVLNVARGGDLVQHLPDQVGHEQHRAVMGEFSEHPVRVDPGSRLGGVEGDVKSHHHQGIGRVGDGLREVAWAEDGTVEALEDPDKRFAVGVLWHPEAGDDQAVFDKLVEEARRS
ncbi:MAG: gamma-glutamyl-gamma-aminobutyrate hydrolase family protein [Actinomycetota bacterium]